MSSLAEVQTLPVVNEHRAKAEASRQRRTLLEETVKVLNAASLEGGEALLSSEICVADWATLDVRYTRPDGTFAIARYWLVARA
jgi:hypothetical protein